jgi:hypothetical protein
MRANGMNAPIHCNATKDHNPVEMGKILDVLTFNHYITVNYSLVPEEHRHLLNHVRLLPYLVELESGIWHVYHNTK